MPAKDQYEHGHKKGNHHHFIERHEKGHPAAGEFKSKVRWGDKHGGYGEHLWDFNHAGHGDDAHGESGDESVHHESYEDYDHEQETREAPQVVTRAGAGVVATRGKRNPDDEVEFISENARQEHHSGRMPKHGGNYRRAPDYFRAKRQPQLYLDASSGYLVDGSTGARYRLTPVDDGKQ